MRYLAALLFAAAVWQATHCPETGGLCHCEVARYPLWQAGVVVALASVLRRRPKVQHA